jgi:hypothetical protein
MLLSLQESAVGLANYTQVRKLVLPILQTSSCTVCGYPHSLQLTARAVNSSLATGDKTDFVLSLSEKKLGHYCISLIIFRVFKTCGTL